MEVVACVLSGKLRDPFGDVLLWHALHECPLAMVLSARDSGALVVIAKQVLDGGASSQCIKGVTSIRERKKKDAIWS